LLQNFFFLVLEIFCTYGKKKGTKAMEAKAARSYIVQRSVATTASVGTKSRTTKRRQQSPPEAIIINKMKNILTNV
jgi:hypothetical protein